MKRITACECVGGGYCPRHRVSKTGRWAELCASDPEYFKAWERGEGLALQHHKPRAEQVPARGLGDLIARGLRMFRLDRFGKKVASEVTGNEDCGCGGRQVDLNERFPLNQEGTK